MSSVATIGLEIEEVSERIKFLRQTPNFFTTKNLRHEIFKRVE